MKANLKELISLSPANSTTLIDFRLFHRLKHSLVALRTFLSSIWVFYSDKKNKEKDRKWPNENINII